MFHKRERFPNRYDSRQLPLPHVGWKESCILSGVMANSYKFTPSERDRDDSPDQLFKSLEFKESRKRSLGLSVGIHGVLLSVLLLIPLLFTETMRTRFD